MAGSGPSQGKLEQRRAIRNLDRPYFHDGIKKIKKKKKKGDY